MAMNIPADTAIPTTIGIQSDLDLLPLTGGKKIGRFNNALNLTL